MTVNTTVERIVYEGVDQLSGASKQAAAGAAGLRKSLDEVKSVLAAVGITVGAHALATLYLDTLKATAGLDDMSESIGASVEGLSAIQRVARVGSHDFDGLTGQLGRMIKGLKESTEEGGKSAAAFDFLGIKTRDNLGHFRDTSAILVELAQKLKGYANDGDKTTIVQDALGKGAERYLPLLKDIAEGTDLHATVTREQAEAAEEAEKNLNRLKVTMEDARRELVIGLTPAVKDITEEMIRASREGGVLTGVLESMRRAAQYAAGVGSEEQELEGTLRKLRELYGRIAKLNRDEAAGVSRGFFQTSYAVQREALQEHVREVEQERDRLAAVIGVRNPLGGNEMPPRAETPPPRLGYRSPDGGANRENERVAKQIQEGVDEEQRIQREAWEAYARFRQNALIEEQSWVEGHYNEDGDILTEHHTRVLENEQAMQDARNKILIEQYDREQQLAIEEGQILLGIDTQSWEQRIVLGRLKGQDLLDINQYIFGALAAQMSSKSRVMFELGKAAAIAETTISTIAAAQKAYEFMSRFGPIAAYAAGAAAYAAGILRVQQIRATSFGGGAGGGGAAATYSAVPGTTVPSASPLQTSAPAGGGSQQSLTLNIYGTIIGTDQWVEDNLMPIIGDFVNRDGIVIRRNSAQAREILAAAT